LSIASIPTEVEMSSAAVLGVSLGRSPGHVVSSVNMINELLFAENVNNA
jgi:hypothetical protein